MSRHLALWRERTADLSDVTTRILEMEGECHQRLKNILLGFLPKRRDLFTDVRGMLDPAVDALETSHLLWEMSEIDKRLEQAVVHFQPGKKRSILSLSLVSATSSNNDKHSTVSSLDDFSSLAAVDAEALKKSENISDYSFVQIQTGEEWQNTLAVVTRQYFLHTYALPTKCFAVSNESPVDEQEFAVTSALKAGPPRTSVTLVSCTFAQVESCIEIRLPRETSALEGAEAEEVVEAMVVLRFSSVEEATEWLVEMQKLCSSTETETEPKPETNTEQASLVRV